MKIFSSNLLSIFSNLEVKHVLRRKYTGGKIQVFWDIFFDGKNSKKVSLLPNLLVRQIVANFVKTINHYTYGTNQL